MSHHVAENHPRADEALDWALGLGSPDERLSFEREMEGDPALVALVEALMEGAAVLAMSVDQVAPSPELRSKVLTRIGAMERPAADVAIPFPAPETRKGEGSRFREVMAWAAAAVFAMGCVWFWKVSETTGRRLAAANQQIGTLERDLAEAARGLDLSRIEVASLKSTIEEYREGVALVLWDAEKQEGVLKLEKMPRIPTEKDYQLWVVDPAQPNPVDAGVVRLDENGFARVRFKPSAAVTADKFAISVEQQGGVPVAQGPIVLVSQ
ncbi:MAG: anti-sigma factor [Verrucomicrobiae bacterium]|nr:anti-sigma factor [Verrucomicrobiae bacterium]